MSSSHILPRLQRSQSAPLLSDDPPLARAALSTARSAPTALGRHLAVPTGLSGRPVDLRGAETLQSARPRTASLQRLASAPAALFRAMAPLHAGAASPVKHPPSGTAAVPVAPEAARPAGAVGGLLAASLSAPVLDGFAAALSVASVRLAAAQPLAARWLGVASGGLWTAAGAMSELGAPLSRVASTSANLFSMAAGSMSTATPFSSGNAVAALGYGSAAAWMASGALSAWGAVRNPGLSTGARVLGSAGGLLQIAAGGASAAGVALSGTLPQAAERWLTASSALWLAGSASTTGAAWSDTLLQRREHLPAEPARDAAARV